MFWLTQEPGLLSSFWDGNKQMQILVWLS